MEKKAGKKNVDQSCYDQKKKASLLNTTKKGGREMRVTAEGETGKEPKGKTLKVTVAAKVQRRRAVFEGEN